jgi:hypothetical protein
MASRVPPTKPAALPPSPSSPVAVGLADELGDGIGEPETIGLAYGYGVTDGYGVTVW